MGLEPYDLPIRVAIVASILEEGNFYCLKGIYHSWLLGMITVEILKRIVLYSVLLGSCNTVPCSSSYLK
jgi:hypothetical protein